MKNKNNKENVIYSKDKIQLALNLLNKLSVVGLEQVKLLAQVSVILESPESISPCEDVNSDENNTEVEPK